MTTRQRIACRMLELAAAWLGVTRVMWLRLLEGESVEKVPAGVEGLARVVREMREG